MSSWIVNSSVTKHVCCSMRVGNGAMVLAKAVGEVRLLFNNKFLVLNNVYYIPGFRRNLISVSRLYEQLFKVSFNDKVVIISRKGLNICSGILDNGLLFFKTNL